MIGIYFSGSGNSKYCVERFVRACSGQGQAFSIEDAGIRELIVENDELVLGYPVYFSNIPKILSDFIENSREIWKNKRIFIIATMGLFSGDGAGIPARRLRKHGAVITGGLHLKMPDCIADEKLLKRSEEENRELLRRADQKIQRAAERFGNGLPQREGLGFGSQLLGLFGQRLYFSHKVRQYSDRLKVDRDKCAGCGLCAGLCPMKNIQLRASAPVIGNRCTMCYRCINNCPEQALTLLGKRVIAQYDIRKLLR